MNSLLFVQQALTKRTRDEVGLVFILTEESTTKTVGLFVVFDRKVDLIGWLRIKQSKI